MYDFLFGPVPSRRLGFSLGIDLVPKKVCSLNCVYCEVGKTTKLSTERRLYIPAEKITRELIHYFNHHPAPDYITFSGYGEPTLNSGLGRLIRFVKKRYPNVPVAVLTNGTLFSQKEVREELLAADLVLPSLDAATQNTFEQINVPASGLQIESIIEGLVKFRKEFSEEIWLEVFVLPGYNNDIYELDALKNAILKIQPNRVQLNTLDRPGRIEKLKAASGNELEGIRKYWNMENVEIIAKQQLRQNLQSDRSDMEQTILSTISRRPCTVDDLAQMLNTHVNEINKYLRTLESRKKISYARLKRGIFYRVSES